MIMLVLASSLKVLPLTVEVSKVGEEFVLDALRGLAVLQDF